MNKNLVVRMSKNNLPYFKTKLMVQEKNVAKFLKRKFLPFISRKFPQHYLVQPAPRIALKFIKENSQKYPYFLRFDIQFYYPSINPQILLQKIPEIYHKLSGKTPSRRFNKYLKKEIPEFLAKSPYKKGLPISSPLSSFLSGIFLLDLDFEIKNPFLRYVDDYLIFCKKKNDPQRLLRELILPKLKELGLELNEKKLSSGRFHRDKLNFIGFDFYAGYFQINKNKIEEFKKKIIKFTYLGRKKTERAIVKSLNNHILGFCHYFKLASCKKELSELDAFIRQRLRRWLLKNKDQKQRTANLVLTNSVLKNLGLKSLIEIKEKYDRKNRPISRKTRNLNPKIGQKQNIIKMVDRAEWTNKYSQKLILDEIKILTNLLKKMERRLAKIEIKLEREKSDKI
ncbi:MAG: reverse transcriptase domain-containing protein [Patescibacteria group bacterium]